MVSLKVYITSLNPQGAQANIITSYEGFVIRQWLFLSINLQFYPTGFIDQNRVKNHPWENCANATMDHS